MGGFLAPLWQMGSLANNAARPHHSLFSSQPKACTKAPFFLTSQREKKQQANNGFIFSRAACTRGHGRDCAPRWQSRIPTNPRQDQESFLLDLKSLAVVNPFLFMCRTRSVTMVTVVTATTRRSPPGSSTGRSDAQCGRIGKWRSEFITKKLQL